MWRNAQGMSRIEGWVQGLGVYAVVLADSKFHIPSDFVVAGLSLRDPLEIVQVLLHFGSSGVLTM
jgi:hypothetical protein